jgi:hypothetical protein
MSDNDFLKKCNNIVNALYTLPQAEQMFLQRIQSIKNGLSSLKKNIDELDLLKEDSGWTRVPNKMMWTHPQHGHVEVNRKEGKVNVIHTTPTGGRTNWGSWNDGPNIAATAAEMTRRKMHEEGMLPSEPNVAKGDYGKFRGGSQYSLADNVKRKAGNIGDVAETGGKNVNVKAYSSKAGQLSAKQQATLEQKKAKKLSGPVKTYSKEEIARISAERSAAPSMIKNEENEASLKLAKLLQLEPVNKSEPTDWISEASKPVSARFSSEQEELEYWRSIKVRDSSNESDSGY